MYQELVQRYPECHSSGYSQESPALRPSGYYAGCYPGPNTPEEPIEKTVAGKSSEIGDPPAARVEE